MPIETALPHGLGARGKATQDTASVVSLDTLGLAGLVGQLAKDRHLLVLPLARTAWSLCSKQVWTHMGYRNPNDFARQVFDRTGRWLQDLSSLGQCFAKFPDLAGAATGLDGRPPLGQRAALLVGRVATANTIGKWIDQARRLSFEDLGSAVREYRNTGGRTVHDDASEPRAKRGVRLHAPAEVRAALDETFDLHHAVAARQGSFASFVDALTGETVSTGLEFDLPDQEAAPKPDAATEDTRKHSHVRAHPVRWGKRGRPIFEKQRRSTTCSSVRAGAPPYIPAVRRARKTLQRMGEIALRLDRIQSRIQTLSSNSLAGTHVAAPTLRELVGILKNLVRVQDEIEMRIAELLLELTERRDWKSLGYQSLEHFAGEKLRMGRTKAHSRVALARGFGSLTLVRDAYESGQLSLTGASWVVRAFRRGGSTYAPEAEQRAWIEHARTTTPKCLKEKEQLLERERLLARADVARLVSKQSYKRYEKETTDKSAEHFPVQSGTRATPIEAVVSAEPFPRVSGHVAHGPCAIPDDKAWRDSIVRFPGRSIDRVLRLEYAVLKSVLEKWSLAPVSWTVLLPTETADLFRASLKATRRDLVEQAHTLENVSPAEDARLRPSERIARTLVLRQEHVPDWVGLLAMIEEFVFTWDDPRTQRLTPERLIAYRDGVRCTAPGCTARQGDAHHIILRSKRGSDDPWNLTFICRFHHHQGVHGGRALCKGTAPLDLVWRLGTKDLATWFRNETIIRGPDDTRPAPTEPDLCTGTAPIHVALQFFDAIIGPAGDPSPAAGPKPSRGTASREWRRTGIM